MKEYLILHPAVDPRTIPSKFELYISLRLGENFRGSIFFPENAVDDGGKSIFLRLIRFFEENEEREERRKGGLLYRGSEIVHFFFSSRFRKIRSVEESENFAGNNALSGETMLLVLFPNYLSKETNSTVGIKVSERKRRLRDYCN